MRSSSRPAYRHPSYSHRTPSRPRPRFAFLQALSAMFSTFNIIRASVYGTPLSLIAQHIRSTFYLDSLCIRMQHYLLSYRGTLSERA